eukprot:TRINITY_DN16490_c0_g1::TRINITY_DN16490_c0_g1_i1::g.1804::m.1804 TRINITY_DN16490_c0_g1::TRINITY_DN16490_c0_g1_i1::g.1804  ORF type:complete len:193 (+),score=67.18,sp/Q9H4K1/RIBC2_HUMAN/35.17/2e-10,RIB43A/PF05914.7/3.2e-37 TRINITY_DN16490_c0_g1_i1:625-1203(+)
MLGLDQQLQDLESLKQQQEKESKIATSHHNLALAAAKRAAEERRKAEEEAANLAEIENLRNDDFLNERCQNVQSYVNPSRINPQNYKGMSAEQLQNIFKQQQEQILARRQKQKNEEEKQEQQWTHILREQERTLRLLEVQKRREATHKARDLQSTLKQQAEDRKKRYDELYNDVYKNEVKEDFFAQFGTTTR